MAKNNDYYRSKEYLILIYKWMREPVFMKRRVGIARPLRCIEQAQAHDALKRARAYQAAVCR